MLSVSGVPIPTSLLPNSTHITQQAVISVTVSAEATAGVGYSEAAHTLAQSAAQRSEQSNIVA